MSRKLHRANKKAFFSVKLGLKSGMDKISLKGLDNEQIFRVKMLHRTMCV